MVVRSEGNIKQSGKTSYEITRKSKRKINFNHKNAEVNNVFAQSKILYI